MPLFEVSRLIRSSRDNSEGRMVAFRLLYIRANRQRDRVQESLGQKHDPHVGTFVDQTDIQNIVSVDSMELSDPCHLPFLIRFLEFPVCTLSLSKGGPSLVFQSRCKL
jgi:hypothetical protein